MTLTIMRTGAGSSASMAVIDYLRKKVNCRVIAVDADPNSVGFHLSDGGYQIPKAMEPEFIPELIRICKKERVSAILPAVDEELPILAKAKKTLAQEGIQVVLSDYESIQICRDKLLTFNFFKAHHIPTPETYAPGEKDASCFGYPKIIKPRDGRGSKGVFLVHNDLEYHFFKNYVPDPIIQEKLGGVEYTIDALADFSSNLITAVPRERMATESGISSKGITRKNDIMIEYSKKIVQDLSLIGPVNIQCFITDINEIKFIEVNPRLAGGVALSLAAGSYILIGLVKMLKGEKVEPNFYFEDGLTMLRYWNEFYY